MHNLCSIEKRGLNASLLAMTQVNSGLISYLAHVHTPGLHGFCRKRGRSCISDPRPLWSSWTPQYPHHTAVGRLLGPPAKHGVSGALLIVALLLLIGETPFWGWTRGKLQLICVDSSSNLLRHWATNEIDPKRLAFETRTPRKSSSLAWGTTIRPSHTWLEPTVAGAMTRPTALATPCTRLFIRRRRAAFSVSRPPQRLR